MFYPTHGGAIADPGNYIEQVEAHRLQRVQEVEAGLAAGCRTTD